MKFVDGVKCIVSGLQSWDVSGKNSGVSLCHVLDFPTRWTRVLNFVISHKSQQNPQLRVASWRRGVVARTPFCNVCDIVCSAFSAIFPGICFTRSRVTKFLCFNGKLKQTSTKILLTTCFKMHSLFYRKFNVIQFELPKYTLRGFSGHLRRVEMARNVVETTKKNPYSGRTEIKKNGRRIQTQFNVYS